MKMRYPLQAPNDDDTLSGGGGNDTAAGGGGDKEDKTEILLRGMSVLAKGLSDMQKQHGDTLEMVKSLVEKGGNKGEPNDTIAGGGDGKSLFDGVDMEQLDRPQFAAMLLTKFEDRLQHHLKEALKPVGERVDGLNERVSRDLATREINQVAEKRPDFMEWRQEIAAIVKENPGLNVQRAYNLARSENPTKAAEMDKKYTKQDDTPRRGFGGLVPGGGKGGGEGATRMKFNEAADKAFDEVLASLGGASLDQLPVVGSRQK